jgi:hypothetical protein
MNRLRKNIGKSNSIYNSLKKIKYLGINLTKDVNASTRRITNHCRKKSEKTTEDGKISYVYGLVDPT